jgi:hypothetical protein
LRLVCSFIKWLISLITEGWYTVLLL